MGINRLTWNEIESWLNVRKMLGESNLKDYEIEFIRAMSEAYSVEYTQASDKTRQAPYAADSIADTVDRAAVSSKLISGLRGLGKPDTGPRYTIDSD